MMFSYNSIYSDDNAFHKEVGTSTSSSPSQKLDSSTISETRISRLQWTSIIVVLLSFTCKSFLPETMTPTLVADVLGTTLKALVSVSRAKAVTPVVSRPFDGSNVWDEPASSEQLFQNNTKIIWGYWNSFPEGFPFLCQKALESWTLRNPGWKIIMLHDDNFKDYVSVSDLPTTFESLKVQHRSDIIRLAVLIRFGGVYMDATSLVYKGFDGIWDDMVDDQLLLTSLNQLPDAKVDMYNNGLLMSKTTQNPFLLEWRRRIVEYSEAPAMTVAEMRQHPAFSRVHQHWDDPTLGVLGGMVPYHSNLWILNDMIWYNDLGLATKHIVHLPKIRWGFCYHTLPHFFDKFLSNKRPNEGLLVDPSHDPEVVDWSAVSLFWTVARHITMGFYDNIEVAQGVLENIHILKFTSHDMPLVDVGMNKLGLNNTVGRILRAAYTLDEFPIQQANLWGSVPPALVESALVQEREEKQSYHVI